jgi:hypothetical protein
VQEPRGFRFRKRTNETLTLTLTLAQGRSKDGSPVGRFTPTAGVAQNSAMALSATSEIGSSHSSDGSELQAASGPRNGL